MKRFTILFFVFIFVLLLSPTISLAISFEEYELGDTEFRISIPSYFSTITRDTEKDAPVFVDYGIDYSAFHNQLILNDCYLDAFDSDFYYEIMVTIRESTLNDLSDLSDIWVRTLASNVEKVIPIWG